MQIYFDIFSGIIGFAIGGIAGLAVGITLGFILIAIIVIKHPLRICKLIEEIKNLLS